MTNPVDALKHLPPRTLLSLQILICSGLLIIFVAIVISIFPSASPYPKATVSPSTAKAPAALPSGSLTPTEQKQYQADMHWLVDHLKANGTRAIWPAFGNENSILVTSPHGTTQEEAQGLALRVYVKMSLLRRKDNFSDADFDQCIVYVHDYADHQTAVDRRGKLE